MHWNFASDDWHCPRADVDLRVGGKHKARMEAKDGSFGFDFEATYEEIIPFERLVYRIADGREVVASFTAQENNCTQLRVTFEAENYHTADGQHDGGQSIFNNLKKYTTTNLSE